MKIKTYSVVDTEGFFIGVQQTNVENFSALFLEVPPPELKSDEYAKWNGKEWIIEKDLEKCALARKEAFDAVDSAADEARASDRSIGQLLDIEYQQVVEAHGRWYADGYDASKCPEEIAAWASAEGVTPLQAAQEIAEAAAHREAVIRQVRSIRLAGKAAVRAAADDADFNAIAGPFIDQLNHIGESTIAAA